MSRKLVVEVVGDVSGYNRSTAQAVRTTRIFGREVELTSAKLDKTLGKFRGGTAAAGAAGLFGGVAASIAIQKLNEAIDVASNLQEQTSKSRVVFGQASKAVEDFGSQAATSIGIAKDQAIEAASSFGSMFANTGQTQQRAAELSTILVQLAGDLSSFNNTPTDDALAALRSGLSGEIEPLRRFQVFLTEAAVAQEALRETGKSSTDQLTQGEKIMARYSLIMQQTTRAQGDYARTADDLANKQRTLNAQWRDSQARIGAIALPIKTELVSALSDATVAANELVTVLGKLAAIKIPPIHVPIVGDLGGGTGGDILKGLFLANPALAATKLEATIIRKLRGSGGDQAGKQAADAARQSTKSAQATQLEETRGAQEWAKASIGVAATLNLIDQIITATRRKAKKTVTAGQALIDAAEAAEKAEAAARKQRQGFDDLLDALSLGREKAAVTARLNDDLREDDRLERAILDQIKVEGRTTELVRRLFQVRQDRRNVQQELRERQAAERQAIQFRALGLTGTGDRPPPTVEALRKQLGGLDKAIEGTFLDTSKTSAIINRIRRVLSGGLGQVGADVRSKVKEILDDLNRQLRGNANEGALTAFHKANARKILADVEGLTPEQIKELSRKFSQVGAGGMVTAGSAGGAFGLSPGKPVNVTSGDTVVNVTVELDGEVISKKVTRQQQKDGKRNTKTRSGPRGGV